MAASSSDDASDIFWPGYVDAIANLAINLLFVIAVMAIVVIGASLQIAELMKRRENGYLEEVAGIRQQDAQLSNPGIVTAKADLVGQRNVEPPTPVKNTTDTPQKNSKGATSGEQRIDNSGAKEKSTSIAEPISVTEKQSATPDSNQAGKLKADIEKLQEANQQLQSNLNQARIAQRVAEQQAAEATRLNVQIQAQAIAQKQSSTRQTKAQAKPYIDPNSETAIEELEREDKTEIVVARTPQPTQSGQGVTAVNLQTSGLLVRFNEGALELASGEAGEVLTKLKTFGPVATTRWRITVVAPKGFSEALRLAYYRANTVRNVLVTNGAPGSAIELRIIESSRSSADNTLVSVRPQP